MKKIFNILISSWVVFTLIPACAEVDIESIDVYDEVISAEDQTEYLKSFAIILSKALYNEPELRVFVKNEALQRRDLDYDVFYPWVKNVEVSEGLTFENILRKYDTKAEIDKITKYLPLLTILIPDWTWVNEECFSPLRWQTDDPIVCVSYLSPGTSHEIYCNGEYAFSMDNNEYSTMPIAIVKNNERIAYCGMTKSGVGVYKFDPEEYIDINADVKTKGSSTSETIDLEHEITNSTIPAINLYGRSRAAYDVTEGTNIPQRDHIYYGMTPTITEGIIDRSFHERLYKIRISPKAKGIFDEPVGGTGTDFKGSSVTLEGKNNQLSYEDILSMAWGEGSIELTIKIHVGRIPIEKKLSVSFESAFDVKQIVLVKEYNIFNNVKTRTYYLNIPNDKDASDCVVSKWVNVNYDLFYWDLSIYPIDYYIEFIECDSGTVQTRTVTQNYSFATNFTTSVEVPTEKIKLGFGFGITDTTSQTVQYTESYTNNDDNFGNFVVHYTDKIIAAQTHTQATINIYTTGYIDAMIVPKKIF